MRRERHGSAGGRRRCGRTWFASEFELSLVDASGLEPGDALAVLAGDRSDGTELRGTHAVTVEVPGGARVV